jgi:pyruvate kinase
MVTGSLFRRTKIVSTLGPASSSYRTIRAMLDAGMDVVRLNFSHGGHAFHDSLIQKVRRLARDRGKPIPIIQDLQGPRFRVGKLEQGYMDLKRGQVVALGSAAEKGMIPVWPEYSFRGVRKGEKVTIGDLGVSLRVVRVGDGRLTCKVLKGGTIHSDKGINFPQSKSALPSLTEKDLKDLRLGVSRGVDFVALSFVRTGDDVIRLRNRLGRKGISIIAKIETAEAVTAIDGIIEQSDAVLVARGDLASEISISSVPVTQKMLIEKCNRNAKPVITATQMLESMIINPQPTRAEASDVANAVFDGSDALMLSGETAIGRYPAQSVRTMSSVIKKAETAHLEEWLRPSRPLLPDPQVDETIAYLATSAAQSLGAAAIITFTMSGSTALRVAKFRPKVPIFAVTPSEQTMMRLSVSYGTVCEQIRRTRSTDRMIAVALKAALARGIAKEGDVVVVTAGIPPWTSGRTNLLKLEVV